jgi:transcription initiation factor TFIIIB Brf1 subunit/transcription initiation factor TFIIB
MSSRDTDTDSNKCKEIIYDYRSGTIICADNGEVLEDRLVDTSHWERSYSPEEVNERIHHGAAEHVLTDNVIGSKIVVRGAGDITRSDTTSIAKITTSQIQRYRSLQRRHSMISVTSDTRNLMTFLGEVRNIVTRLGLPARYVDEARKLYLDLKKADVLPKGIAIKTIAAGIVAYMAKRDGIADLRDIANTIADKKSRFPAKEFYGIYKRIAIFLGVPKGINAEKMISLISSRLLLPSYIENKAKEIYRRASEIGITSGKSHRVVAAACIYIASRIANYEISKNSIAKTCGITDTSIRIRSADIALKIGIDHPDLKMNSQDKSEKEEKDRKKDSGRGRKRPPERGEHHDHIDG